MEMTREKLLRYGKEYLHDLETACCEIGELHLNFVRESIKALEQEPKWIPVGERLPEKNVEVLATTEWGAVTIAEMYSVNDWFIYEGTTNAEADEIVAWMPLPKPYEPQESEG